MRYLAWWYSLNCAEAVNVRALVTVVFRLSAGHVEHACGLVDAAARVPAAALGQPHGV